MAGFSRRQSEALIAEILAIRCQLAAERVLISLYRLYALTTKAGFDPSQPRLPRGATGGGRWTDGGGAANGSSGRSSNADRMRFAQARTGRGPRLPVRTSRGPMEATPRQEVEAVIATMQADRAIGLVRRVDPNWSPRPSLHSTIEGEIAYQRRVPGEADAYLNSILRRLGAPAAPPRRIGDNGGPPLSREPTRPRPSPYTILAPEGRVIGYRQGRASDGVMTLPPDAFDSIVLQLTDGLQGRHPINTYDGVYYYYDLPDRCVIGFRISRNNALTIDIIESERPDLVKPRSKLHRGR